MTVLACPRCVGTSPEPARGQCPRCGLWPSSHDRLWLASNDTCPDGFDAEAADRLSDLAAQKHFWMRERQRLMARLLKRVSTGGASRWQRAIELGCGTGEQLPLLESVASAVVAVDGHRSLLRQAHARSTSAVLVQADVTDTALPAGEHDLVTAFDVIEHVDADAFLAEARRLARPGADLLVSAPAFPSLWSDMDVRAGHRCRYRLEQMRQELQRNGWRPTGHTHYQCLLFPLVYASRRWSGSAGQAAERRPSPALDRLLGAINHFEVQALGNCSLPFGSSLFVWAKAVAS